MGSSEWIAVIALAVSIVFGGLSWLTARGALAAAVKSAEESGKSGEAAQRAVALSERAEGRALAEREDARGPVFHVGDQESRTGTALAALHDDEAQVRIAQVAGPDLEVVVIKARGLTGGVDHRVGNLVIGGTFTEWERPILHVPTTVSVYSETTATSFTFELVLECVEREPGDGCWDRRYTVQAIDRAYGPRLGSTGTLNSARVEGTGGGRSGGPSTA